MTSDQISPKNRGRIGVEGLRIDCIIGVFPEERVRLQPIYVDLEVMIDFTPFMGLEASQEYLSYVELAALATDLAKEGEYFLIEKYAVELRRSLLLRKSVYWTRVRIRKPGALADAQHAFVELEGGKWDGL